MTNSTNENEGQTHFGFRDVSESEKAGLVGKVFHSVAGKYDLMNDLMSLGAHRIWKKFAVDQSGVHRDSQVLDVAGGTGDMAALFSKRLGPKGRVVVSDINESMLSLGRDRLIDKGITGKTEFTLADAEALPFEDNLFDCVCVAFGLRNMTHKQKALESMYRVTKPGGYLLVLEFSKPVLPGLDKLYDVYSFKLLPFMGRLVADDEDSYRYLAESIRKHPDQETLKQMMDRAGFSKSHYFNLSGGIVALHKGYKI